MIAKISDFSMDLVNSNLKRLSVIYFKFEVSHNHLSVTFYSEEQLLKIKNKSKRNKNTLVFTPKINLNSSSAQTDESQ